MASPDRIANNLTVSNPTVATDSYDSDPIVSRRKQLGFIADIDNAVTEDSEANNASDAIQVTVNPLIGTSPDLTANNLTVSDPTLAANARLTFSYTVSNIGAASAAASFAGLYLSTDSTITTSDRLLAAENTPALGSGQSNTLSNAIYDLSNLPTALTPGNYWVGVIADYPNQIAESSESNNVSNAVEITVTAAPVPDLKISTWNPSSTSGTAGSNLTVNYTVANIGNGSAGASTAGIYLSTDSTITTSDTLLGSQQTSSISANNSVSNSTTVVLPTTPGTYWLGVVADINNAVVEGSETNNASSAIQITVTAPTVTPPDLQAGSLTVSNPTVAVGGQLTFSYNVSNTGAGSAAASSAGLYLSTDSTITTSDTLEEVRNTPSLSAGQSSSDNNVVWDVPSTLAPGNYWVGVIADYPNQIAESSESNNVSNAVEITVTAAPVPDLKISTWNPSSTSGTAGSNLTVNYTVANIGNGSAGASTAGIYLSTDSTITTSDTLLGSQQTSSISANNSVSNSTTVVLPTTPGTYWLGVVADINNAVVEGSETNNASSAIQITVTAPTVTPPDLQAGSLTVSNPTVAVGGQLTFSYNVSNTGAGSAAASSAGLYLSTDSTITTSDTLEEVRNTPSLSAGQSSSDNNVVWDVPSTLAPGNYWVGVIADYPNQIAESSESNNVSNAVEITVTAAPVPDLKISTWNPSSTSGTAGSNLTVNYTVANIGNGSAGASTAGIYLSTDSTITTSDTLLGSQQTSSISANNSVSNSTTVVLPTTPGTYWLGVVADINNAVVEGSETNNASSAIQITVTAPTVTPPDLQAGSLTVSNPTVAVGGQLTFSYNVSNTGAGSAAASSAGLYLSTDSTITTSDTLEEVRNTPSLSAGQSSSDNNVVWDVPSTLAPGNYWVGVIADYPNQIAESSESNNASNAVEITVTAAAVPDLTISTWNPASTSGLAGSNITVSYTVHNNGSGAAGASTTGIYLSNDSTISTSDQLLSSKSTSSLTGGTSVSDNQTIELPTTPGTYYLGVISDINNAVVEGSENDNASNAVQITVTGSTTTLPSFSISNAGTVTEGNNAVFTVTMSGSISAPDTIWYSTFAGTASAADGDYPNTYVDLPLTFNPGGSSTQQIVIPTNVTQNAHPDTFSVGLQKTQTGGAFTTGTATIVANSGAPSFSISNAGTVTEGNNAVFTVTMSGSISAPDTIWYSTFAGTASAADGDYPNTYVDLPLTFNPGGSSTQQIVIPTNVTQNAHPDTFSVGLQKTQTGGAFTTGTATIVAIAAAPPGPTTAPPISELPTALLATPAQPFYNLLLQQASPNLTSYLTTDTSITTPELGTISANYLNTLSAVNNNLSAESGVLTLAADGIAVTNPTGMGLITAGVGTYLATPAAKNFLGTPLDQGATIVTDGVSLYTSCTIATLTAEVPVLDLVTAADCGIAALTFGIDYLNIATSLAVGDDPPDPNYQEVFVPPPIAADPMPATGLPPALATAFQSAITDVDQATQWMYAIDVTENRYSTACAAGDANAASMQYAGFLNDLGLYMSAAQAANTDLMTLSSQLQANGIGTQSVTTQELATALSDVQTQDTSSVNSVLESLGFTDSQIQTMAQEVQAETIPSTLPSETGNQALSDLASDFSSVTFDTTPPVLAIASTGGLTNQTTQTISGTIDAADAGLTVSIYDGATLLGAVTPAANGNWSKSVTLLSTPGAQAITAQTTDAAGNVGKSNTVSYTLDTLAYDAEGNVVSQTIPDANGGQMVNTYDPENTSTSLWSTSSYDANGNLLSQTTTNDDGTHALTIYDVNNSYNWSSATINFDAQWNETSVSGTNDDGSHTTTPKGLAAAYDTALWFATPFDPNWNSTAPITLTGDSANDFLVGNAGNDMLVAGTGNDIFYGNGGSNTFAFGPGSGQDKIMDFQTDQDVIQFNPALFANYAAVMQDTTQVGANAVIQHDANTSVTLENTLASNLTANNFHFS